MCNAIEGEMHNFQSNLLKHLKAISTAYVVLFIIGSVSLPAHSQDLDINLAQPLLKSEIHDIDITIFPDGKNLPVGQGSVIEGQLLYKNQCQMCHGENGIEGPAARLAGTDGWFSFSDPLRILRIEKYPVLLISVGSLWPYATSIFDYIRRAMPHYAPKSLSDNDSYALTAYILNLNDIVNDTYILDKDTILTIEMPAQKRSELDVQ